MRPPLKQKAIYGLRRDYTERQRFSHFFVSPCREMPDAARPGRRYFGLRLTAPTGPLNPSRAAEADRDPAGLQDDWDLAPSGELDHPGELVLVLFDVDVSDGVVATRVVLTGLRRVGSGVLSEDLDRELVHCVTPRR